MLRIVFMLDFSRVESRAILRGVVNRSRCVFRRMPVCVRDQKGMEWVMRWCKEWGADAVVGQFGSDAHVTMLRAAGIAVVGLDYDYRPTGSGVMAVANTSVGQMAAADLLEKGFRNFAFWGLPGVVWSDERRDGFEAEIARQGMRLVDSGGGSGAGTGGGLSGGLREDWTYDAVAAVAWLKALPKPVAILACDDAQGAHLLEACGQAGVRVPEEVAVMGVGNDEEACALCEPQLSSVELDWERAGTELAELLEHTIADEHSGFEDVIVLPSRVVTRPSTDVHASEDYYISLVLRYIHRNLDQRLKVEDLVKLVPLSRRLLEMRFRQVTGVSVYTYVLNLRLDRFARRLAETDDTVVDIALSLGYADQKNVSRIFKNATGLTPSEYREKHNTHYENL